MEQKTPMRIPWVRWADFRRADGSHDWEGYWKAQTENGERCPECSQYTVDATGHPAPCGECLAMRLSDATCWHRKRLRCPHCGAVTKATMPTQGVPCTLLEVCAACEQKYFVEVEVIYNYRSPARVKAKGEAV